MRIDSDDSCKANARRQNADPTAAETIEASDDPQLSQPQSFLDGLELSFSQAFTSSEIGPSSRARDGSSLGFPGRRSLGEPVALTRGSKVVSDYGEKFRRGAEQAAAELMKLTPLERMNRRYPNLKLHSLPRTFPFRDLLGEPNVDVCLEYYQRFTAALESEGDEPVSILLEFLTEHPIEFGCSGWILYAVGYIVLGYPTPGHCERRARKLFSRYWRDINSPKHQKSVLQTLRMSKACRKLDSPHAAHWRGLVTWMAKADERGLAGSKWFDEYTAPRPNRCACLTERGFRVLRKAYVKIARRYEEAPPASAVVLEAVAAGHGVSSRALAEHRANAKKRTRKQQ